MTFFYELKNHFKNDHLADWYDLNHTNYHKDKESPFYLSLIQKKEEYIRNKLGHKEWFDIGMEIESKYRNKGKYKNDIDSLIYLRKHINPKIKFKFSANKTETKIKG